LDYKLLISSTNVQLLLLIGSLEGSTKCHHNTCLLTWNYIPKTYAQQGGVSHCGLAIYIKKMLLAKEELWKFKYFTMQKYNLQKLLQDIIITVYN